MTIDLIASVLLVLGALMPLLAGIAVLARGHDEQIHAATKPQVLGIMLLMLGLGLSGSPGVIGMLVLDVILRVADRSGVGAPDFRVAFRNAKGEQEKAAEPSNRSAADDSQADWPVVIGQNESRPPTADIR